MMTKLANRIFDYGLQNGMFTSDEREWRVFSYLITFEQVIVWACIFMLAIVGSRLQATLAFSVFYVPLRVYAGGFHARTFKHCFLLSVGVYLAMLIASQWISSVPTALWFVTAISIVIIAVKAPIADPNKAMQDGDYEHYRKMVFRILSVELCAFAGFITWGNVQVLLFICFSFVQLAGMLILSPLSHGKKSD